MTVLRRTNINVVANGTQKDKVLISSFNLNNHWGMRIIVWNSVLQMGNKRSKSVRFSFLMSLSRLRSSLSHVVVVVVVVVVCGGL